MNKGHQKKGAPQQSQPPKSTTALAAVTVAPKQCKSRPFSKCAYCKEAHFIGYCKSFADLAVPDRRAIVSSTMICFNCLSSQHRAVDAYISLHRCFVCKAKHHTKLHLERAALIQNGTDTVGQTINPTFKPKPAGYALQDHIARGPWGQQQNTVHRCGYFAK